MPKIKYRVDKGIAYDKCPHFPNIRLGSCSCSECSYFVNNNHSDPFENTKGSVYYVECAYEENYDCIARPHVFTEKEAKIECFLYSKTGKRQDVRVEAWDSDSDVKIRGWLVYTNFAGVHPYIVEVDDKFALTEKNFNFYKNIRVLGVPDYESWKGKLVAVGMTEEELKRSKVNGPFYILENYDKERLDSFLAFSKWWRFCERFQEE